jgi:hypothetical protein
MWDFCAVWLPALRFDGCQRRARLPTAAKEMPVDWADLLLFFWAATVATAVLEKKQEDEIACSPAMGSGWCRLST